MKVKTEEFLYSLLWAAEHFFRPTVRNLTDSYEDWLYKTGFWRQVSWLEKRQLLERSPSTENDRVYRLTEAGRLHALGGRDPKLKWSRYWDGTWRLVIFDIPVAENAERQALRRYLRNRHFGCLQGSMWVTPDPLVEQRQLLAGGETNVSSLILIEGKPCAGESDRQIVSAAWDWQRINRCYDEYLAILHVRPARANPSIQECLRWSAAERAAWLDAVQLDPLLPERLLPRDYQGQRVWRERLDALADLQRRFKRLCQG